MSVYSQPTDLSGDKRQEQHDRFVSMPLYFASLIVTLCGLYAVNLDFQATPFWLLMMTLATLGVTISYFTRVANLTSFHIRIPILLLFLLGVLFSVLNSNILDLMIPSSIEGQTRLMIAVVIAWLSVLLTFLLTDEAMLMFTCVPAIALIGMTGALTSDSTLVLDFLVFIFAAAFMLIHENALQAESLDHIPSSNLRRAKFSILDKANTQNRRLGKFNKQIVLTAFCVLGAAVLANFITTPLSSIGSSLLYHLSLQDLQLHIRNTKEDLSAEFNEESLYNVGTGPVSLSNEIIMEVEADEPHYWRASTFNQFSGRSWKDTIIYSPIHPQNQDGSTYLFNTPFKNLTRTHPVAQKVTFINRGFFKTIYAAAEPRQLIIGSRSNFPLLYSTSENTIRSHEPLPIASYTVTSLVPDKSPELLKAISSSTNKYPLIIMETYLQLPSPQDGVDLQQIQSVAIQVTRNQPTVYDKVEALMKWIGQQCKYNLRTPAVPGDQPDVVSYFLFNSKEGYCDSFATALAIMCRTINIPSRVADGYLPGDYENGVYKVRDLHRHMWTEVFFPTVGWVTFDATSLATDITNHSTDTVDHHLDTSIAGLFGHGPFLPLAMVLCIGMLVYVFKVEIWNRRPSHKARRGACPLPETNLMILDSYNTVCTILSRRGLIRLPADTPTEYIARIKIALLEVPGVVTSLDRLTHLVMYYRYSPAEASPEDVRKAQETVTDLQRNLKNCRQFRVNLKES